MRSFACMVSALTLVVAVPALAATEPATPGQAQAASTPATPYTAAQFFETTSFSMANPDGLAFSEGRSHVLISSDQTGVFNAYALPVAGGAPVPLTASTTNATFAQSYFPDGRRILVAADQGGNELTHIYVRETDGTLRDLTPGDKVKAGFVGFSDDGQTFWLTSNERDASAFDVYAYDATTYERKLVFQNPGLNVTAVSGDGRLVALIKSHTSANSDIYLADLQAGGEPYLISEHTGDVAYDVSGFGPNGATLIYTSNQDGEFAQAYAYDIANKAHNRTTQADWDVMYVSFSPNGRYRVTAVNADASTELTIEDAQTRAPVRLTGLPQGDITGVRFDPGADLAAFTVVSDTSPADVFIADLSTGQARRLTSALNPAIKEGDLVEATIVRYPGEGGVMVPAVLYRPKGASAAHPAPAVVLVHGGPGGQTRRGYSAMVQHLVNHGYAVLGANNRGSSGYGKTFFHMDDKRHGEADLRDIVAGGDWLRAQDWVADDQVAVMGGSYGGYITAAALAFHPDKFEAGIDIFGVTNWVRTLESIPAWWGAQRVALFDEMGDPATDAVRHRAISPLFHAEKIQRPLLVIQGANDPRVLQVESDELVEKVRANNVPVEYVVFPDEGHGFQRRANRIKAQESYLAFLNRYVRKAE
ncbi:S9 family peptidase [Brevundimonas bullata]|uniref:S9 family peptidase n=1 Tax=Brevundimonas bullata TaxID=13160 RepID=UPI0019BAE59A|nr:S9 family peptidase [Brevundimonas sp.]